MGENTQLRIYDLEMGQDSFLVGAALEGESRHIRQVTVVEFNSSSTRSKSWTTH
jgi:hypothetical protein